MHLVMQSQVGGVNMKRCYDMGGRKPDENNKSGAQSNTMPHSWPDGIDGID